MLAPFATAPKGTTIARVIPMGRALASLGHDVLVLIPPYDNPGEARDPVVEDSLRIEWIVPPAVGKVPVAGAFLEQLAMARTASRRLREWRPDVFHAFKPKAVSGLVQLDLWHRPAAGALVLDCDDWEGRLGWSGLEAYPSPLKWVFEAQERVGLPRNDGATVASGELYGRLRSGSRERPVVRVPNFHDPVRHRGWDREGLRAEGRTALGISEDVPLALVYTRFFEYPLPDYARLLDSFLGAVPGARVVVVGAGKYGQHARLERLLADRGIGKDVIFLGWLGPDRVSAVLAAADVALMPAASTVANRSKCPARLLDLVVTGTPVAAHDVGEASTYVVHDGNGVLAPPADPEPLAAAAASLIGSAARRRSRETSNRLLATALSQRSAARAIEDLYQQALERRARR